MKTTRKIRPEQKAIGFYNRIVVIREYDIGSGIGYLGKKLVEFRWLDEGKALEIKNIPLERSLEWIHQQTKNAEADRNISYEVEYEGEIQWFRQLRDELMTKSLAKLEISKGVTLEKLFQKHLRRMTD